MEMERELFNVLSAVVEKENWKNFKVQTSSDNNQGNGFLGELYLRSVTNKDTNETLYFAIKKAFKNEKKRENLPMRLFFVNEITFYSKVVPCLDKFLKEKDEQIKLEMVPKHYLSIEEEYNETIVLGNLIESGYDIFKRETFFDDRFISFVIKTYAKFHAVSFAFKNQKPEEYKELTSGFVDLFDKEDDPFYELFQDLLSECFDCLDEKLKEHCGYLLKNGKEEFLKVVDYKGNYFCILHGDCWSNNMMFKYKNEALETMKLIDFQLFRQGTPVFDLSFFLYGGGSKEIYKNLDKYLEIYYDSFSTTVTELGSDPQQLYPFSSLKEDWKKYSKYGLLMGLWVIKLKLINSEKIYGDDKAEGCKTSLETSKTEKNLFETKVQDLTAHCFENGFI